jgi:hypothetical protein
MRHTTKPPTRGANLHRIGLPIVAGPYTSHEEAVSHIGNGWNTRGEMVVAIPKGRVPEDWDEE